MKKFLFLFLLLNVAKSSFAQNCYWANGAGGVDGDNGNAVATDGNGNIYTTGSFGSPNITFGSYTLTSTANGMTDMFLVKYNSLHNVVWAKRAGGLLEDDGNGVAADAAGNVFVTGAFFEDTIRFSSTVYLVNNNNGNADFFLVKYDSNGNPVWATRGTGGSSDEVGKSITLDGSGNIYVGGYFYSPSFTLGSTTLTNSGSGTDIFFAKFNSSGVAQWAHSAGGSGSYDYCRSISADNAGNVWITGSFACPTITFGTTTLIDSSNNDIFIAKYNTSGTAQWARSIGGNDDEFGLGIAADGNGNAYLTGEWRSNSITLGSNIFTHLSNFDFFLAKYDGSGNVLWAKSAATGTDDIGRSVSVDANNDVYVLGDFGNNTSITFGSTVLTSSGGSKLFVVKYDQNGNQGYAISPGTGGNLTGNGIAAIGANNFCLAGNYGGSVSFGSSTLNPAGATDIYTAHVYNFTPTIPTTSNVSCFGGNDGSATVAITGGMSPFTYQWSNSQTNPTAINLASGGYTVTVTDVNGCAHAASTVITQPVALALSFTSQNLDCSLGQTGSITANVSGGIPAYTYSWNTTETTQSISGLPEGTYAVTATDANNCTVSNSITLTAAPAPVPPICMVTVDPASQYNIVVWDKTSFTDVDSFIIYREITTNNYQPIGVVPYDSLSQFIDTVRTLYFPNTGDPNAGTYRYKIQANDSCGNYSLLSPYHNTIYISQNGGTFSWVALYTIENGPNPVMSYLLLRDNLSNGTWIPVNSVAGTQQTVSDPNYSTYAGTASWRVETFWNISCTPTLRTSTPEQLQSLNSSYSNIMGNFSPLGMTAADLQDEVNVYPTVTNGIFTLEIQDLSDSRVEIYSAPGQLVYSSTLTKEKSEIDLTGMSKGMYFVHVFPGNGMTVKKVIVK
jgi:hypothetical protein